MPAFLATLQKIHELSNVDISTLSAQIAMSQRGISTLRELPPIEFIAMLNLQSRLQTPPDSFDIELIIIDPIPQRILACFQQIFPEEQWNSIQVDPAYQTARTMEEAADALFDLAQSPEITFPIKAYLLLCAAFGYSQAKTDFTPLDTLNSLHFSISQCLAAILVQGKEHLSEEDAQLYAEALITLNTPAISDFDLPLIEGRHLQCRYNQVGAARRVGFKDPQALSNEYQRLSFLTTAQFFMKNIQAFEKDYHKIHDIYYKKGDSFIEYQPLRFQKLSDLYRQDFECLLQMRQELKFSCKEDNISEKEALPKRARIKVKKSARLHPYARKTAPCIVIDSPEAPLSPIAEKKPNRRFKKVPVRSVEFSLDNPGIYFSFTPGVGPKIIAHSGLSEHMAQLLCKQSVSP